MFLFNEERENNIFLRYPSFLLALKLTHSPSPTEVKSVKLDKLEYVFFVERKY